MEIVTSWMEKGIQQGIEKGIQLGLREGKRELLLHMLRKRLAGLPSETEARLDQLSGEQLEDLAEALLDFAAPSDLATWLDGHAAQ